MGCGTSKDYGWFVYTTVHCRFMDGTTRSIAYTLSIVDDRSDASQYHSFYTGIEGLVERHCMYTIGALLSCKAQATYVIPCGVAVPGINYDIVYRDALYKPTRFMVKGRQIDDSGTNELPFTVAVTGTHPNAHKTNAFIELIAGAVKCSAGAVIVDRITYA